MRATLTVLLAAAVLVLCGCINRVDVRKYTGSEDGLVYSLPKPYLLVTPRLDGGIDVETIYLPDADQQYAVKTQSIMSSYKLDVSFEHGMLKGYSGKQDTTAVAAAALANTGEVLKQRIEAQASAKAEEGKSKQATQKAIADAQLEYAQALAEQAAIEAAEPEASAQAKLDAAVKVARAEAKLNALTGKDALGGFNMPGAADPTQIAHGSAWGPVLFAIIQTREGVELKAVNAQRTFETIALPKKEETPPKPGPKLSLNENVPVTLGQNGKVSFQIVSTIELAAVSAKQTQLKNTESNKVIRNKNNNFTLKINKDDARIINVELNDTIPSGKYQISPAIKLPGDKTFSSPSTVDFAFDR